MRTNVSLLWQKVIIMTFDTKIDTSKKVRNDAGRRLPHERDEAPDDQQVQPRRIMEQAASDLEQGLVDTDRRGQRGVEQVKPVPPQPGGAKPLPDTKRD